MDPMDFTMDDSQGSQQQNGAAHQHQCQFSSAFASRLNNEAQSSRGIPFREGQPYDPVHDNSASAWYHGTPSTSNNAPSQVSYPQVDNAFGGSFPVYQPSYSQYEYSSPAPAPLYRYMGGHDSTNNSSWMDRGGHPPSQPSYATSPPYYYQPPTMSASSEINAQHTASSQSPSALPTPNHHATAQRRAWQASRTDHENIRSRINAQLRAIPGNTDVPFDRPNPSISAASGSYHAPIRSSYSLDQAQAARLESARVRQARTARIHAIRSSDDDDDDGAASYSPAERFPRHADYLYATEEDEERVLAAVRGAMAASSKSVPSKDALASLINLTIDEVKAEGGDINCIICYNDFGTPNPEGIIEFPLRLPKCRHLFGNVCIKKWFEDADSCPYCRDKLPSEASNRKSAMLEQYRLLRDRERPDPGRLALARARYESTLTYHRNTESTISSPNRENERMQRDFESVFTPSRMSSGDSPERRRPNRGRANGRPNQPLFSRTIPSGSSRLVSSQRTGFSLNPTATSSPMSVVTPHRTFLAGSSNASPPAANIAASISRANPRLGAFSTSSEEASPAVAVGSFVSPGDRLPEQFPHEMGSGLRSHDDALSRFGGTTALSSSPRFDRENSNASNFSASATSRVAARAAQHARNMPYDPIVSSIDAVNSQQERNFGAGGSPMPSPPFRPRWTR